MILQYGGVYPRVLLHQGPRFFTLTVIRDVTEGLRLEDLAGKARAAVTAGLAH
jgi:hypothetical protein